MSRPLQKESESTWIFEESSSPSSQDVSWNIQSVHRATVQKAVLLAQCSMLKQPTARFRPGHASVLLASLPFPSYSRAAKDAKHESIKLPKTLMIE